MARFRISHHLRFTGQRPRKYIGLPDKWPVSISQMIIERFSKGVFTTKISDDHLQFIKMDPCPVDLSLIFVPCSTGLGFVSLARDGIPD